MKTIKSAMPVLIETGLDKWPYAVRGTFFVAKVAGNMYVVTARHVVEGNSATSVFFRYRSSSRYSLPLDQTVTIKEYAGPESPECTDVILYRIAVNELSEPFVNATLDTQRRPWSHLTKGDSIIFRGYPSELQSVEASSFKEQGVVLDAKYCGPGTHPGCHEIELFPTELFTFHDGFIGSPVFRFKGGATQLVGVLVKASSYQNRAVFGHLKKPRLAKFRTLKINNLRDDFGRKREFFEVPICRWFSYPCNSVRLKRASSRRPRLRSGAAAAYALS